ncbi:hypothetical protein DYB32_004848 [Aphanomyces invadans]|uniref:Glutathione S-transferase n=1 Tax=Aphanomyces invadans TaxID=157072 RepID=A0A3R6Y908_9STRA|nr:hypothetical protein DYB32_004848 [Aphanomyces invadans]
MSLELVYFDETWRAEAIRLLLAYGNKSYEDTRLSFPAYSAAKPTLGLPFGQLPVLRTNGKTYAQSIAIARYVAKEVGLYPTDNLDALEVDSVVDAIVEMTNVFVDAVHSMKGEDHLKASIVPINEKIFPRILAGLEARLVGPYFLGDKISYADIFWLDFYQQIWEGNAALLTARQTDFPKLVLLVATLRGAAPLIAYWAAHPAKPATSHA